MPTITVAIPCYNYANYLPICLNSVLAQEGVDLEVIIVDDCSTDDTPQVCEWYATDSRIKIIRHEKNLGAIASYNDGINAATGKYFTLVSSDDVLTPGALKRAVTMMEKNPNVGMVYGPHVCIDEQGLCRFGMAQGSAPIARTVGRDRIYKSQEWQNWVCRTGRCFLIGSEAVVRTSIQRRAGLYDPTQPHAGDAEMWLRISNLCDIGYVGVDQLLYRVHAKSMQMTIHHGFEFDLGERRKAFQQAFGKRAISTENLIAAEHAIDRLLYKGEGGWWHRVVAERLRHKKQRRIGVAA